MDHFIFPIVLQFVIIFAMNVRGDEFTFPLSPPKYCDRKTTYFRHGHSYTYQYQLLANIGLQGGNGDPLTSAFTCHVTIDVPRKCEIVLRMSKCTVKTSQDVIDHKLSAKLSDEMGRVPVYFGYDKGEVIMNEFVIYEDEERHVVNLKRGLVSMLQMKIRSGKETSNASVLQVTYPSESSVMCQYKITPFLALRRAECQQQHTFSPFALDGQVAANISQKLQLLSKQRLKSLALERYMEGRRPVQLSMDIDVEKGEHFSKREIHKMLEAVVYHYLNQGNTHSDTATLPAQSFREFVKMLRETTKHTMHRLKRTIYTCADPKDCFLNTKLKEFGPSKVQALMAKIFIDGLLSCGNDGCIELLAKTIKEGLVEDTESRRIIFNMGLFYQPSLHTAQIIYEHCKKDGKASSCWLSLTAMLPHFASDFSSSWGKVRNFVYSVLRSLEALIGNKCEKGVLLNMNSDISLEEDMLLTAMKAISNIGRIKNVYRSKTLSQTLMTCISNQELSAIISRSAIQALADTGLVKGNRHHLLKIVQAENWPTAARIAAFNALIVEENKGVLQTLLNLFNSTKQENMKTYITTRIYSIIESDDPKYTRVRELLLDIMKESAHPSLGYDILSKSHYVKVSHFIHLPWTSGETGGNLDVMLIYTPTSNIFQTLMIKADILMGGKKTELLELAVDTKGLDAVVEIIGQFKRATSQEVFENFQKILLQYLKILNTKMDYDYQFIDESVLKNLQKIVSSIKMENTLFPTCHISMKLLGKNVGFLSVESILKQQSKGTYMKDMMKTLLKGINLAVIKAFRLTEFHQFVPTLGGYSIETEFDMSIVMKGLYKSAPKKPKSVSKREEMEIDILAESSVSFYQEANARINAPFQMGRGIKSKATMESSAYFNGTMTFKIGKSFGFVFGIKQHLGHDLLTFYKARSEIFSQASSKEKRIKYPAKMEATLKKCLPEHLSAILGRTICLSGNYFPLSSKINHFTYPTMALMNVKGVIKPSDPDFSALSLTYQRKPKYSSAATVIGQQGYFAMKGKGSKLKREVDLHFENDQKQNETSVTLLIKDAQVYFTYNVTKQAVHPNSTYRMAFDIHYKKRLVHSIHVMRKSSQYKSIGSFSPGESTSFDAQHKAMVAQVIVANGDLSFTVNLTQSKQSPTHWTGILLMKYHCKPALGLFYLLHPDPKLAAKSNHTSDFYLLQDSESSQKSFAELWTGTFTTMLDIPGQRISSMTNFSADLSEAKRTTYVNWNYGSKKDTYKMISYVANNSKPGLDHFDYTMSLSEPGKFDVELEGHFQYKSMSSLMLEAKVLYNTLNDTSISRKSRMKRSLSSLLRGLKNSGYKLEEKLRRAYSLAKSKWLRIWRRDSSAPVILKGKQDEVFSQLQMDGPFYLDMQSDMPETRKTIWERPRWEINFVFDSKIRPKMIDTPSGMHLKELSVDWNAKTFMSDAKIDLFACNGTLHKSKGLKTDVHVEDAMHSYRVDAGLEQVFNDKHFFHKHHWNYYDDTDHYRDRFFSVCVNFEHYRRFEYNLKLVTPNANVTHDINYTKVGQGEHKVRAHGYIQAMNPEFYLLYLESSDMKEGVLHSQIKLESTLVDHNTSLVYRQDKDGLSFDGTIDMEGKLPFIFGKRSVAVQSRIAATQPPSLDITFIDEDNRGTEVEIVLVGPKKIKMTMASLNLSSVSPSKGSEKLTYEIELTSRSQLQHTITMSPDFLKQTQLSLKMVPPTVSKAIRKIGHSFAYYTRGEPAVLIASKLNQTSTTPAKLQISEKTKKAKLYSRFLQSIDYIWKTDPRVIMLKTLHLDDFLAESFETMTEITSTFIDDPPLFIFHYTKRYLHPILEEILKSRQIQLTTSMPFTWRGFKNHPEPAISQQVIAALVKRKIEPSVALYRDMAVITAEGGITTFDGITHTLGQSNRNCTHLLSGDFKQGRFILTYTQDGIVVTTTNHGIILGRDGLISSTNSIPMLIQLPYMSKDKQISLTVSDGEICLTLFEGLAQITLNPVFNFYLVGMSKRLNNASVGLLGTNNMEIGDDIQHGLNGKGKQSIANFQNSFELSGSATCKIKSPLKPLPCLNTDSSHCLKYFSSKSVALCFWSLDPAPFIHQCQENERHGRSVCTVVVAFLSACQHKGIKTSQLPTAPEICRQGSVQQPEIIIVQSLHMSLVNDPTVLAKVKSIFRRFSNENARIGHVTYGGSTAFKKPKSHLINNRLLEDIKRVKNVPFYRKDGGLSFVSPEQAIKMAAVYPFSPGASKTILLISTVTASSDSSSKTASFRKFLEARGIKLEMLSTS